MRILHLTSTLDRGSGVMSIMLSYAKLLKNRGIYFDFLYFNESSSDFKEEIKMYGGRSFKIERPSLKYKYRKYIKKYISELNKNNEYSILHIHDVYLTFLFAPIAKKNGIKNIITHSHATSFSDKFMSSIRNRILCLRIKKHSTKYVACSEAAGRFLYGKKNLNKGNVSIIKNAIDPEKFQFDAKDRLEIRLRHNIKEDIFLIGHIGRIAKQKNHKFLIKRFKEALKENEKLMLVLIGDGPIKSEINTQIVKSGLSNNIITISFTTEINKYLSAFDLFVMPSLFEGLPIVGVEAQCSGLPAIFSTSITSEICFDYSTRLSLRESERWVDEILKKSHLNFTDRKKGVEIIKENGYDIKFESEKLTKLYEGIR